MSVERCPECKSTDIKRMTISAEIFECNKCYLRYERRGGGRVKWKEKYDEEKQCECPLCGTEIRRGDNHVHNI
jgi:Zn finger protein HypA/HybF involved in hydrogenase expression